MEHLRKLVALGPGRRRVLISAFALLAAVRLSLFVFPFAWVRAVLDRAARRLRYPASPDAVAEVGWAIGIASRFVPKGTHCLSMALAAQTLLERRGCPATLHFGIPREPGPDFVAHAWVKSRGVIVSGGANVDRKYIELAPSAAPARRV